MVMPVIVIMGKVRILFVMNGDGCKNRFLSSYKMVNFLFGPPLKSDVKKVRKSQNYLRHLKKLNTNKSSIFIFGLPF